MSDKFLKKKNFNIKVELQKISDKNNRIFNNKRFISKTFTKNYINDINELNQKMQ